MLRRLRRIFTIVLVAALVLSSMMTVSAQATDTANHWAAGVIDKWISRQIITGYTDGSFKPDNSINRAEFAVILNRIFKFTAVSGDQFSDVPAGAWFADAVSKAYAAGVVKGDGTGKFQPYANISRQEAAVMLARAFELKAKNEQSADAFIDSSAVAGWAKAAVSALYEKKYISGKPGNKFAPADSLTRAEAVKIVDNTVAEFKNAAGTYTGAVTGNVVVNTADVVLKDMAITGDLYLTQGIGEGEVTLDNVTVSGKMIVRGGGENSIILNNTSIGEALVVVKENGKIRILAKGSTEVPMVSAGSGATLQEEGTTGKGFGAVEVIEVKAGETIKLDGDFESVKIQAPSVELEVKDGSVGKLEVAETANDSKVTITSGTVASLEVKAKSDLNLVGGTVTQIEVKETAADTTVNVNGASVANIDLKAAANLDVQQGTVAEVNITEAAANTTVNIASTAKVETLTASAAASVTGSGTITNATITANNVTIEQKPATTTVTSGVSTTVGGETQTGTAPVGGGGGGGGTTTQNINVSSVSLNVVGKSAITDEPGTEATATLDLSALADSDKISGITIVTDPSGASLSISSVASSEFSVNVSKTFTLSGSAISIASLLSDNGNTDVSLGTLRQFFGGEVTIAGTLSKTGYTSKDVDLVLDLGQGVGVNLNNDYFDIEVNGSTINATITGNESLLLGSGINILGLFDQLIGELPSYVSLDGGVNYLPVDEQHLQNIRDDIVAATGASSWNTVTLGDLSGLTIKFKKSGADTVYTVDIL